MQYRHFFSFFKWCYSSLLVAAVLPLPFDILDSARVLTPWITAAVLFSSLCSLIGGGLNSYHGANGQRFCVNRAIWLLTIAVAIAAFARPYFSLSKPPETHHSVVEEILAGGITISLGDTSLVLQESSLTEKPCRWELQSDSVYTSECLNLGFGARPAVKLTPRLNNSEPIVFVVDALQRPEDLQVSLRRVATIIRHSGSPSIVIVRGGRNAWSSQWRAVREVARLKFAARANGLFNGFAWMPNVNWQVFVPSDGQVVINRDTHSRLWLQLASQ
jgi:hypothetical protein